MRQTLATITLITEATCQTQQTDAGDDAGEARPQFGWFGLDEDEPGPANKLTEILEMMDETERAVAALARRAKFYVIQGGRALVLLFCAMTTMARS
jgi:hypothetical protein